MSGPEHDETSIGRILIAMGLVTPGQVARAHELQRKATAEQRLGIYLVAYGHVSLKQLSLALSAQEGLRSKAKHKRALAQASIAESSAAQVVSLADRVRSHASEVRRQTTGTGYPAITPAMEAAAKKE